MSKIRQKISTIRNGVYDGKMNDIAELTSYVATIIPLIIIMPLCAVSFVFLFNGHYVASLCVTFISFFLTIVKEFKSPRTFLTGVYLNIVYWLFGKNGKVISKKDWKRIKRADTKLYHYARSKRKSCGHCYMYSLCLGFYLHKASIMYCSVRGIGGVRTAHAVLVKDGCVYDTNFRRHHDFDEYIKFFDAKVYKIFPEKIYKDYDFFKNIKGDFINWCNENDVICLLSHDKES